MSNYLVKMKPSEKLPDGSIYVDQEACPVFIECQVTFGSTKVHVVPLDEDYPEGTYYKEEFAALVEDGKAVLLRDHDEA